LQVAKGQTNDKPKSDASENDSIDVQSASTKQTPHETLRFSGNICMHALINRLLLVANEIRNIQVGKVKYVQFTKAGMKCVIFTNSVRIKIFRSKYKILLCVGGYS
jgi:hypothetical protein